MCQERVDAETFGLAQSPGTHAPFWSLVAVADAVHPVVGGGEVPAWPADRPRTQLLDQVEHIGAHAVQQSGLLNRELGALVEHPSLDVPEEGGFEDRKSTRLTPVTWPSRMPSSA